MKVRKSNQTMPKEKYKFTMKLLSKMDTLDIKKQTFAKVKKRRSEKLDLVDEKYLKMFVKKSREENSKKVILLVVRNRGGDLGKLECLTRFNLFKRVVLRHGE